MARAGTLWTESEWAILESMVHRGFPVSEIRNELIRNGFTRSYQSVRDQAYKARHVLTTRPDGRVSSTPVDLSRVEPAAEFDPVAAVAEMRDRATLGISKWHDVNPRAHVDHDLKILSLSDLHIPFFHAPALTEALSEHADADILILNGDLLEVDMASSFPRQKLVLLKYEYKLALKWLDELSRLFPKIVLVAGNHEERTTRYLHSKIDPGMGMLAEGDMLWRLSRGYGFDREGRWEQQYDFDNVSYSPGLTRWFVQIGQAIFCHPWRTSSMTLRSVELAHQWFSERGFSYQAIFMGHTHRFGSAVTAGKLLIEQGCLCVPLDYANRADIKYRPTTTGYAVAYLDQHGNVDFNATRPVYVGTASITPSHVDGIEEVMNERARI